MAETDILHQYKSFTIYELYDLLFYAIRKMVDAADGKDQAAFLDRQNEVFFIKSIIEEKKAEMRSK